MSGAAGVVVAAGRGERLGADLPKAFVSVGGQPMFVWALRALSAQVDRLVLVAPAEHLCLARMLVEPSGPFPPLSVVPGGATRPDSVLSGLLALQSAPPEIVAIQDAARPLTTPALVRRCIEAARQYDAIVPALPVTDTLKRAGPDLRVIETPDRRQFWAIQTPQTFSYDLILSAYRAAGEALTVATDDASLVEAFGHPVQIVEGEPSNIKVTTLEDLRLVEGLLGRNQPPLRIGHGFDLHRLVEGRALVLGGVIIPYERGLLGHSDADALFHAISDALLGSIAAGDIGQHFPDTDPRYAGANSADLAAQVAALVRESGYSIANVDATVICQRPKLAPHVAAMRANIANALGVSVEAVGVKATTTEGLGATGRGEAIAVEAVALVTRA